MAKCKLCGNNIPDDKEYCESCFNEMNKKSNESYLDSLLNSVKNSNNNTASEVNYRPNAQRKTKVDANELNEVTDSKDHNESSENVDDFMAFFTQDEKDQSEQNSLEESIKEFESEEQESNPEEEVQKDYDIMDSNDWDPHSNILSEAGENQIEEKPSNYDPIDLEMSESSPYDLSTEEEVSTDMDQEYEFEQDIQDNNISDIVDDYSFIDNNDISDFEDFDIGNDINNEIGIMGEDINPAEEDISVDNSQDINNNLSNESESDKDSQENYISDEMEDNSEDNELDQSLGDLLYKIDEDDNKENEETILPQASVNEEAEHIDQSGQEEFQDTSDTNEDDDFLKLLQQVDQNDPVAADLFAINQLLNGSGIDMNNTPTDVGEVFSDALTAVKNLNDPADKSMEPNMLPNPELVNQEISDTDNSNLDKKKKKDKKSKEKKNKENEIKVSKKNKASNKNKGDKEKKSFFERLFEDLDGEEENAASQEAVVDKKKKNKKKDGAKNAKIDSENKAKDRKVKKGQPEEAASVKTENAEEKKDNKDGAAKDPTAKDLKKLEVIDVNDIDQGHINRFSASAVFIFFGLIVLLLIGGTQIFSYSLSIKNASNYFNRQKYTQAFEEVDGMDIKAEDLEIYNKIITVMFVNKQLNSYNNYFAMKQYPQALDSLLKGLKRYDKYIEFATILGVKTDLDYVRSQIISELDNEFNISEKEAMKMIKIKNQDKYSLEIYNMVLEKMNLE